MPFYGQFFKSADQNAPVLNGTVGSLVTLLNKCLVDGYTTASVTSIVRKGTGNLTALVTMAANDATLYTGAYATIAGATPAAFNGANFIRTIAGWQASVTYAQGALVTNGGNVYVCTVAGTAASSGGPTGTGTGIVDGTATWDYVLTGGGLNLFTYQLASDPGVNASGTLTYAKSGLQWTRPFAAGTNAQTFRSADPSSNQFYLQVIDNATSAGGAKEAVIYGAEVMSADQAVVSGRFPTTAQNANGQCCRKSITADATARVWTLWGDGRTFFLVITTGDADSGSATSRFGMAFGYFKSFKAGDLYNTFIAGNFQFNNAGSQQGHVWHHQHGSAASPTNIYLARSYSQVGSAVTGGYCSFMTGIPGAGTCAYMTFADASGGPASTYPNATDSGYICGPVYMMEGPGNVRGKVPSLHHPIHTTPLTQYDEITGIVEMPGTTLVAVSVSGYNSGNGTGRIGQIAAEKFAPYQTS